MSSQERRGGIEVFGSLSRSLGCTPNNPRCATGLRNGICGQSWSGALAPLCRRSVHIAFWLAWCVTTIIVITEQPVNPDGRQRPDLSGQRRRTHPQDPPHDHRQPLNRASPPFSAVIASARRARSNPALSVVARHVRFAQCKLRRSNLRGQLHPTVLTESEPSIWFPPTISSVTELFVIPLGVSWIFMYPHNKEEKRHGKETNGQCGLRC